MNVKLITKAMRTLSLLSEDDVQMVMKLRGLSEDERQMLMLVLEPQKPGQKKSNKKSAGGRGKSKHASSLQSAITNRHGATDDRQRPTVATDDNEDDGRCAYKIGEDIGGRPVICDATIDNNVHHKQTDPDYHQFKPAEQAAVASGD